MFILHTPPKKNASDTYCRRIPVWQHHQHMRGVQQQHPKPSQLRHLGLTASSRHHVCTGGIVENESLYFSPPDRREGPLSVLVLRLHLGFVKPSRRHAIVSRYEGLTNTGAKHPHETMRGRRGRRGYRALPVLVPRDVDPVLPSSSINDANMHIVPVQNYHTKYIKSSATACFTAAAKLFSPANSTMPLTRTLGRYKYLA